MMDFSAELHGISLFEGIEPQDIPELLGCLQTKCLMYKKDEIIIEEGSDVQSFGIVLSGHGRVIKWDESDRVVIITMLQKGSVFGVMVAASSDHRIPVTVQALETMQALIIPFDRIIARCTKNCRSHEILLRNYIHAVAEKGLELHERVDCLLRPSARGKVLVYLERLVREQGSRVVSVPFNRNAMAQYLNIERSALSRELSNMKRDGLLDYYKNSFKLLELP